MSTSIVYYTSPIGIVAISSKEDAITSVLFTETAGQSLQSPILSNALEQLDEYFANKRNSFDLPLAPEGTDFQKRVWNELLTIPFGKTTTYLDMAKRLGDEKVIRAAASANGKNPIAIIIPCHRVIGSDGKLTGYAGGLWRKEWLLKHEGVSSQVDLFS
jgi:methylated-DNA-[protein]-cysteine S-methyltransferase